MIANRKLFPMPKDQKRPVPMVPARLPTPKEEMDLLDAQLEKKIMGELLRDPPKIPDKEDSVESTPSTSSRTPHEDHVPPSAPRPLSEVRQPVQVAPSSISNSTPILPSGISRVPRSSSIPINDTSLLTAMATRLAGAERELKALKAEVQIKDKLLDQLNRELDAARKVIEFSGPTAPSSSASDSPPKPLLNENHRLKKQIQDMERFLNDYGMIWVGDGSDSDDEDSDEEPEGERVSKADASEGSSGQESSGPFPYDMKKIQKSVHELNLVAGDGIANIIKDNKMHKLRAPDPVPIVLYQNGIILADTPFRQFGTPTASSIMQDLLDGYFPYELKDTYPDGVPLKIVDKSDIRFDPGFQPFSGHGNKLVDTYEALPRGRRKAEMRPEVPRKAPSSNPTPGSSLSPSPPEAGASSSSNDIPSSRNNIMDVRIMNDPGRPEDRQAFLNRLPKNVVRNGKVIPIRDEIAGMLQGHDGKPAPNGVVVVETPVFKALKARSNPTTPRVGDGAGPSTASRPATPRDIATLHVKSEDGKTTYLVKLRFDDTVGMMRDFIAKQRGADRGNYELRTNFPNRAYTDLSQTLRAAGLIPNAVLFMRSIAT